MQGPNARPPAIPIAAPAETLPETLPALLTALWQRIAEGVRERWTPWGLPSLATVGPTGEPQSRVLSLKSVDSEGRRFGFHTDVRSDKVEALAADPRASILFWDPFDAVEARFAGRASLFRGERHAWCDASPLSRSASAVELAPGTQLYASTPFEELPAAADESVARARFMLIEVEVTAIDWLWLGPRDMRRARFHWTGTDWAGTWVVP